MKIAEVRVSGCRCETVRLEPIPRGIVGAVVAVEYTDPAWDFSGRGDEGCIGCRKRNRDTC